jgi:hypothetical protein
VSVEVAIPLALAAFLVIVMFGRPVGKDGKPAGRFRWYLNRIRSSLAYEGDPGPYPGRRSDMGHAPTSDGPGVLTADEWVREVSHRAADHVTLSPRDVVTLTDGYYCPGCRGRDATIQALEGRLRQFDPVTDARMRAEGR